MKNFFRKMFASTLAVIMIISATPLSGFVGLDIDLFDFSQKASAADTTLATSGQCGENVFWTFDESTGLLTISGTGEMTNYSYSGSNASPFNNNTSIKSVVVEDGVTNIGTYAFRSCSSLLNISLPNSLTDIGSSAFAYCDSLSNIQLPGGLDKIESETFYGCSALETIHFSNSIKTIGYNAFTYCRNIKNVYFDGSAEDWCDISYESTQIFYFSDCSHYLYLNDELLTNLVLSDIENICDFCFKNCVEIQSVTLNNVTNIGTLAFSGCTNLENIDITGETKSIKPDAFYNSMLYNNWENDNYNGVLYIGKNLIKVKETLSGWYYVNAGTVTIADDAVAHCQNLTNVYLPDSIKNIGDYAFSDCGNLHYINLPDGIEKIGRGTFGSSGINNISIPDSVTIIDSGAFACCNELRTVIIPNSVLEIRDYAFGYCENLSDITMSSNIIRVGDCAFSYTAYYNDSSNWVDDILYLDNILISGMNASGDIVVKDGTRVIADNAFNDGGSLYPNLGNKNITSVKLPDGLVTIGENSFYGCSSVTSISVPCSLQNIFDFGIAGCNFSEIQLPIGLKKINDKTLYGFTVLYSGTEEQWQKCLYTGAGTSTAFLHPVEVIFNCKNNFNHNYTDWEITKKATCTEKGIMTYTCSCGDTYTEDIPLVSHSLTHVKENATCTKNGAEYDICSGCGNKFNEETIKATGHNYTSAVTKEATCTEKGVMTFTCSCGDTYTEDIPLVSHSLTHVKENATCTKNGAEYDICSECGNKFNEETIKATGHNYTSAVTKEATCTEKGVMTFTCSCGDSYTEEIPLAEHKLTHFVEKATCTENGSEYDICSVCKKIFNTAEIAATGHTYEKGVCKFCGKAENWNYTLNSGTVTITGYTGHEKELEIPAEIDNCPVTTIAESAFANNTELEYVLIPNSVFIIGKNAFRGCANLKEICISDSVTTICEGAFADCTSLAIVYIASVNTILEGAFFNNDSRLTFIIPDGTKTAENVIAEGFAYNTYMYPKEKDGKGAIAISGAVTLYGDLDYYYWSKLIEKYPYAFYIYFDMLTFDGILESDVINFDDNNLDISAEYLTMKKVYISINIDGKNIAFKDIMKMIENGSIDSAITFEDSEGIKITFFQKIGDFFEDVFNALSKAINAIVRIFKKK